MKKFGIVAVAMLLSLNGLAQSPAAKAQYKGNGFTIDSLEDRVTTAPHQALIMCLTPTESFAPNVNIQIQPYEGTFQEYIDLSKAQFTELNFKILSETRTENSAVWEYEGELGGRKLHWYSKVEFRDGKAYIATATATESQWKKVSAKLKSCVDSFKMDAPEPVKNTP
jgi:hypothetical protein